eukprot:1176579-Prorocentrum_minimum.AAC.9
MQAAPAPSQGPLYLVTFIVLYWVLVPPPPFHQEIEVCGVVGSDVIRAELNLPTLSRALEEIRDTVLAIIMSEFVEDDEADRRPSFADRTHTTLSATRVCLIQSGCRVGQVTVGGATSWDSGKEVLVACSFLVRKLSLRNV